MISASFRVRCAHTSQGKIEVCQTISKAKISNPYFVTCVYIIYGNDKFGDGLLLLYQHTTVLGWFVTKPIMVMA